MIREIGNRIILVGVAHILPKSIKEVSQAIQKEKPEIVGVELCQSRYLQLMENSSEKNRKQTGISRAALIGKILEYFQKKMGEKTGMMPGDEMLTAVEEAREVGAEVSLIDRDISLTLQRLVDEMSFWEKIKIFFQVLISPFFDFEEFDLDDLTEEEVVEELISVFRDTSEDMYRVLLEERNKYMADRIAEILKFRSGKVVCVVGAGHIPGLEEELEIRLGENDLDSWDNYELEWTI